MDTTFGPRPDQLARMITRPCYPSDQAPTHDNHYFRCIASSVCNWKQKSPDRQLYRIYKHATRCRALRSWKPDLFTQSEHALADMAPGGFQLPTVEIMASSNVAAPHPAPVSLPASTHNPFAQYDPTTNMTLFEEIDHTIARLICESASPATLVDHPIWAKLLRLVGPQLDYSSPGSSYVRDKLIPAEAQRSVLHMREYLLKTPHISISFDGLTAGEQPVYAIHTCTGDRHTFLYNADVFYGSHNTDYMVSLLENVSTELAYYC